MNMIMEYQKIINLLDNISNEPSKFRKKMGWNNARGRYNTNCLIKFKTAMLKSSLCDYSDAYIHVKGTIPVINTTVICATAKNDNKKVISKYYAPFTDCISERNNTQVYNAKDIDVVIPVYNLTEYSVNYS